MPWHDLKTLLPSWWWGARASHLATYALRRSRRDDVWETRSRASKTSCKRKASTLPNVRARKFCANGAAVFPHLVIDNIEFRPYCAGQVSIAGDLALALEFGTVCHVFPKLCLFHSVALPATRDATPSHSLGLSQEPSPNAHGT